MAAALNALLPVLLVTAIGWAIARWGLVAPDQWLGFEAITYYVLLPSLFVISLAQADFSAVPVAGLGAALVLAVITMTALCLLLRPMLRDRFGVTGPRFTSVLQGATRWNSFVALALAASLYGPQGVALTAVAIVAIVPLLNVINVTALSVFASGTPPTAARLAMDLGKNPLIWSCAVGIALNLLGNPLPGPVLEALRLMGGAALAAGLLAAGAALDLSALRRPGPALGTSTVLRLVGMPLLATGFARLLGVTGVALGVAVIAAAVPTASAAYLLARRMGGDAKLMTEIITLQTVLAAVTLPLAIALLT